MRRSAVRTRLAPFTVALGLLAPIAPIAPPLLALDGDADTTFSGNGFVSWTDGGEVELADVAVNESTGAGFGIGNIDLAGVEPALHWKGWSRTGGSLDQGCAQASSTLFTFAVESEGRAGLVDSSGNLVVAGWAAFVGSESTRRAIVARFDLSGPGCVLDDTFSSNGWVIFDDDSWCDTEGCEVVDLVEIRQTTGGVLTPRIVALVRSDLSLFSVRYFLLGLTSSGGIDAGFGTGGWAEIENGTPDLGPLFSGGKLALDALGRIYMLGARYDPEGVLDVDTLLFRYSADGERDIDFGNRSGAYMLGDWGPDDDSDTFPAGVAIGAHGVSASAYQYDGDTAHTVTFLDDNFDFALGESTLIVADLDVQGNGRIVSVGDRADGSDGFTLERRIFGPNETVPIDESFGSFGFRTHDIDLGGANTETVTAMGTWGGRIVVAGTATTATGRAGFLLRTQNAYVFADGFEQGTAALWTTAAGIVFPE